MKCCLVVLLALLLPLSVSAQNPAHHSFTSNTLFGIGSYDLIDTGKSCAGPERPAGDYGFFSDFSPINLSTSMDTLIQSGQEAVFVYKNRTFSGFVDKPYCYSWEGECTGDNETLWSFTVPVRTRIKGSEPPLLVSTGDFIPPGMHGTLLSALETGGIPCAGLYLEPWPNPWDQTPEGYLRKENVPEGPTQCNTVFSSDSIHVQISGNVELSTIADIVGLENLKKTGYSENHFRNSWIANMSMLQLFVRIQHKTQVIESQIDFHPDRFQDIMNALYNRKQSWTSGTGKHSTTLFYTPEIDKHIFILFAHGNERDKAYTFLKLKHETGAFELLEKTDPNDPWCH